MPRQATGESIRGRGRLLSLRLKTLRSTKGLSQVQLAAAALISIDTLRKLERGDISHPGVFTVDQLAAALETTVDDLIQADTI